MGKRTSARTSSRDKPKAALEFFDQALMLLEKLRRTQADVVQQAADLCADRIARGGLIFLFGNGHSRMLCEEMTPRQGCFPGFVALVEWALSNHVAIVGANGLRAPLYLENYEGYAEQILRGFRFGRDFYQRDPSCSGRDGDGSPATWIAGDCDRLESALRAGRSGALLRQKADGLRRHCD
jgi:hypothetical protein